MTLRAFYHNLASGPHTNDESRPVPPDVLRSLGYQFWSIGASPNKDRAIEELTKKAKEQGFCRSDSDAVTQADIDFSNVEAFGGDNEVCAYLSIFRPQAMMFSAAGSHPLGFGEGEGKVRSVVCLSRSRTSSDRKPTDNDSGSFTWGHDVIICALEGEKIVYLEGVTPFIRFNVDPVVYTTELINPFRSHPIRPKHSHTIRPQTRGLRLRSCRSLSTGLLPGRQ